jgi:hypothetical protein
LVPLAHEGHLQRALYSAPDMQNVVKGYADKLRAEKGVNLQVRVSVNIGEVVVRSITTDQARTEYTPIASEASQHSPVSWRSSDPALSSCDEPGQDQYNGHCRYDSGIIGHLSIPPAAPVAMPDSHGTSGVLLKQFRLGNRSGCKKNDAV